MTSLVLALALLGQTCGPNGCPATQQYTVTQQYAVGKPQYVQAYVVQSQTYASKNKRGFFGLFKKKCR